MKLSFALFFSAASASVLPRAEPTGTYTLSNVSFHSTTHRTSGTSNYTFHVTDSADKGTTTCSQAFANNQELPTFNYTACADPQWSFALLKTGSTELKGQFVLKVTRQRIIDGHRTNNETSCNLNDIIYAMPIMDPRNAGTQFQLQFGDAAGGDVPKDPLTMGWVYGPGSKCP